MFQTIDHIKNKKTETNSLEIYNYNHFVYDYVTVLVEEDAEALRKILLKLIYDPELSAYLNDYALDYSAPTQSIMALMVMINHDYLAAHDRMVQWETLAEPVFQLCLKHLVLLYKKRLISVEKLGSDFVCLLKNDSADIVVTKMIEIFAGLIDKNTVLSNENYIDDANDKYEDSALLYMEGLVKNKESLRKEMVDLRNELRPWQLFSDHFFSFIKQMQFVFSKHKGSSQLDSCVFSVSNFNKKIQSLYALPSRIQTFLTTLDTKSNNIKENELYFQYTNSVNDVYLQTDSLANKFKKLRVKIDMAITTSTILKWSDCANYLVKQSVQRQKDNDWLVIGGLNERYYNSRWLLMKTCPAKIKTYGEYLALLSPCVDNLKRTVAEVKRWTSVEHPLIREHAGYLMEIYTDFLNEMCALQEKCQKLLEESKSIMQQLSSHLEKERPVALSQFFNLRNNITKCKQENASFTLESLTESPTTFVV